MKTIINSMAVAFVLLLGSCQSENTTTKNQELLSTIEQRLPIAVEQYQFLSSQVKKDSFPKTYHKETDELELSNSSWWCSGFYPGTMLYLQEATNSNVFEQQINSSLNSLEKEQFNTGTHDLGFMMFDSFGNANRIQSSKHYDSILINSAKSLSTRYVPSAKIIRSWNSGPWNKAEQDEIAVIIDNMMNLELLMWAAEKTNDQSYSQIAINHANTTLKHHFRADDSSYHEIVYKEKDGSVSKKITKQGYSDESAWARGQAWGLYGYTSMYRITKDKRYLEQADRIASFILNHKNMPEDFIPYWDFDDESIPDTYRDSSAASIIASALIELSTYSKNSDQYLETAEIIMSNLLSDEYFAKKGENGGFLLKHAVGHLPGNSEVDVPLSYGDYYLIEAILRYKSL